MKVTHADAVAVLMVRAHTTSFDSFANSRRLDRRSCVLFISPTPCCSSLLIVFYCCSEAENVFTSATLVRTPKTSSSISNAMEQKSPETRILRNSWSASNVSSS